MDFETMERYFVTQIPNSTTRKRLFENLQNYIQQLQKEVFPWFEMWVDGSFMTLKENPKDIDVVTLLDYKVYEARFYKLMCDIKL